MSRLTGKIAIVTGAAAGIGRETARRLAAEGASVVVADRNSAGAAEVAATIGKAALAVEFDATDAASIEAVIATTTSHFGGLDILHNNVAMTTEAWSRDTNVLNTSIETWDLTMSINLRSMFVASKAALPHMIARGGGSIINMSSGAGVAGAPGLVAYGTSKAGVITFTKYLAVQYGRLNVRANCILPGLILTQQIYDNLPDAGASYMRTVPFNRAGKPSDVAAMVAYLASDDAQFVNGQAIHCDGGGSAGAAEPLVEKS
jgi:NAD(P)-dependent dehydrogenase (short-subunit alcohol dehydrogenase family)